MVAQNSDHMNFSSSSVTINGKLETKTLKPFTGFPGGQQGRGRLRKVRPTGAAGKADTWEPVV